MKAVILFHDEEEILRSGYLHHASSKSNNYHDITYYVEG